MELRWYLWLLVLNTTNCLIENSIMVYTSVENPRWASGKDAIFLCVKFDNLETSVDFLASPYDSEPHGRELYVRAMAGDFGAIQEPVKEKFVKTLEQKQADLKNTITNLLEAKAKELNFESFADALTYCDEPAVPLYQKQAQALRAWRSGCWIKYDEVLATNSDFFVQEVLQRLPTFIL